jgi:hypothetical protein
MAWTLMEKLTAEKNYYVVETLLKVSQICPS